MSDVGVIKSDLNDGDNRAMPVELRRYIGTIRTPEVLKARRALVEAIKRQVEAGQFGRDMAESQISSLLADIWLEAEKFTGRLRGRR
jgi:hypothetical protein